MDKFKITGGKVLKGKVAISGAKNSALPVMAASLLTAEPLHVHNIPKVRDLITMSKLLTFMHVSVATKEFPASDYTLQATKLNDEVAPYELVKTMRASILTLGPLIARVGVARVSLPGGCAIGARPVDLHLTALEKMGAEVATKNGYIEAKVSNHGRLGLFRTEERHRRLRRHAWSGRDFRRRDENEPIAGRLPRKVDDRILD